MDGDDGLSELWHIFQEVDKNRDGALDREELQKAFHRAGMEINDKHVLEFLEAIDMDRDGTISYAEWRDFLLLLPRHPSIPEIYSYYQAHRRDPVTILTPDGDFVLGEKEGKKKESLAVSHNNNHNHNHSAEENGDDDVEEDEEEEEPDDMFKGAGKFLLAGGIAGAVSRTATAPFDRLKIYLITSTVHSPAIHLKTSNPLSATVAVASASTQGIYVLRDAITALYRQGGMRAFFVGNGLNVIKIFPESAVKFLSYESSKRLFARYWDRVDDVRDISGASRFVSGGIGGIISQLMIYPIETLKTRVMSSTGGDFAGNKLIIETGREMWRNGGMRAYFKGLIPGLVGVFPYSAIDMSVFEGLKVIYTKWTNGKEPGVFGVLAIGSFSGGIGATSVYPLNLVRTRMQAQGTPAHPQIYGGFKDVAMKTWENEGVRGFYRGLTPTLGKVVPSVALSWLVYEQSKKLLFEQHEL
ncbi:mitochondrial carrier [Atractiella rhizophila]|nr:mitochondrial carrier [Atractiella rhizophila]